MDGQGRALPAWNHCRRLVYNELFLLNTRLTPDRLRMDLSRPVSVIRAARLAVTQDGIAARPASLVDELAKLADMLGNGLCPGRNLT